VRGSTSRGDTAASAPEEVVSRSRFIKTASAGLTVIPILASTPGRAFEGGIGGLGKTRPDTGVVFLDGGGGVAPGAAAAGQQDASGYVSAELLVNGRVPVRVGFRSPWPLLPTTSGLEARDLREPESAFVQVVTGAKLPSSSKEMRQLLLDSVLSQRGKFGAYGTPVDVKVKLLSKERSPPLYAVTFTTYTPGQRESERQVLVRAAFVANSIILLVAGTTRQRFPSRQAALERVCDSFEVFETPATRLRR